MDIYCIEHEAMFHLEQGKCVGHAYVIPAYTEDGLAIGSELDFCCLPSGLAYCPPPDESEDPYMLSSYEWTKWMAQNEPSPEEIEISDLQAAYTLLEMELS
jgi:hypothetical protein